MASKITYPCFQCRKSGHDVQVFLDGKDEQGHTKYLNEDMTRHTHLGSSSSNLEQQHEQQVVTISDLALQVKLTQQTLERKMDSIIELLNGKINQG